MANFLTSSESSVADANANAFALASATRRKNAAYNALSQTYGPAAGDPEAQAQLIANDTNQQEQADKVNKVSNETATSDLTLDQAQRADNAWQGQAVLNAVRRGVAAGQDPAAAIDSVSHYLPSLGVDPAHVQPLVDMIRKDPTVLDKIGQQLGPLAGQSKIKGQPIYTQDAAGKYHISYPQEDGTLQELKLPDGQSLVSSPEKSDALAVKAGVLPQSLAASGDPTTALKRAIIGQESGGNPGIGNSTAGAVGMGQILPATFAQFAKPGEKITNPADNATVSGRIIDSYMAQYHDPARAAVAYFSGPGNVAPAGSATPYLKDIPDTNGVLTSHYVSQVLGRMGPAGLQLTPAQLEKNAKDAKGGNPLSDSAIDLYAETFNKTGKMPPLSTGASSAAIRSAIAQRAADKANASGDDAAAIIASQQAFKERGTAVNDLGKNTPTSAGGRIQSAGALINHMQVFGQLADALGNGNIQAINAAQNAYKAATGNAAPTNMALAKTAIGDEAAKFIAVANVGKGDREAFQKQLAAANSPAQLKGAVQTLTGLAAGQLGAMRQRYQAINATKEFDAALTPAARTALGVPDSAPPAAAGGWKVVGVK